MFRFTKRFRNPTPPGTHRHPRTARLNLEILEDRTTPSILFGSSGLTTSDGGGPVLPNVQLELVFWGSGWTTSQANAVQSAVDDILAGPYLSGLAQYRSNLGGGARLGSAFVTSSSPGSSFTNAQVDSMLKTNIANGTIPVQPTASPNLLYMVITQPGSSDPTEGLGGEHTFDSVGGNKFRFGWTINDGTLDTVTKFFSHELAEAVSDPEGTAIQVNPRNTSSWNEVADGAAENFSYRLDGVLVQSYFSQADHSFIVPTGQHFSVNGSVLTVSGDQRANPNDTIIVTLDSAGGVQVTLNGEIAIFEPNAITSVRVNTGGGVDSVLVQPASSTLPVTVTSVGPPPLRYVTPTGTVFCTAPALTGDVNGDGRSDMINTFYDPLRGLVIRTALGQANGTFAAPVESVLGDGPGVFQHPVLTGNVYGTGRTDLIFTFAASDGLHLRTAMARTDGTYAPTVQTILGDGPGVFQHAVLTGNVYGTGRTDLIFTFAASDGLHIRTAKAQGNGTFAPTVQTILGDGPGVFQHPVLTGNEYGHDLTDLIFTFSASDGLHLRTAMARTDGTYAPTVQTILGDGPGVFQHPVLTGNEYGHDLTDLIFTFSASDGLHLRTAMARGNGSFAPTVQTILGDGPGVFQQPVLAGNVYGTGRTDLIFTFAASDGLHIRTAKAQGNGTFAPTVQTILGDGSGVFQHPVLTGNVYGNHRADLIFSFEASDGRHLRTAKSLADGTFVPTVETRFGNG